MTSIHLPHNSRHIRFRGIYALGIALLCIALASLTGCVRNHGATVIGTVTLDGIPLQAGSVTFHPVNGGPLTYGNLNQQGAFKLSTGQAATIFTGQYQVTVVSMSITIGGNDAEEAAPEYLTPKRYSNKSTSGIEFDVKEGPNKFDIELTSNE